MDRLTTQIVVIGRDYFKILLTFGQLEGYRAIQQIKSNFWMTETHLSEIDIYSLI